MILITDILNIATFQISLIRLSGSTFTPARAGLNPELGTDHFRIYFQPSALSFPAFRVFLLAMLRNKFAYDRQQGGRLFVQGAYNGKLESLGQFIPVIGQFLAGAAFAI